MSKNRGWTWAIFTIWYGLLWVALIMALLPILRLDYELIQTEFRRWTWAIFISPSAYVFFSALVGSLVGPFQMLLLVPVFFVKETGDGQVNGMYKRRYIWTLFVILGIVAAEIAILTLMWGSFPLDVDAQHRVRLRMIPFIPWPEGGFLVFP
jgi:hypothetical protein